MYCKSKCGFCPCRSVTFLSAHFSGHQIFWHAAPNHASTDPHTMRANFEEINTSASALVWRRGVTGGAKGWPEARLPSKNSTAEFPEALAEMPHQAYAEANARTNLMHDVQRHDT